ncbi:MAG: hypothetical protein R6X32_16475 [Chloroflexota bacterium]
MSLSNTVKKNFKRSFDLYRELVESLDESQLSARLPKLPSNTIGEQIWCVVGARESYSRAIHADAWSGFSCSLTSDQIGVKAEVLAALRRSEEIVLTALAAIDEYTATQSELAIDLLEHEAAHHGQLIRYLYGLRIEIPQSWKSRYALH